MLEGCPAHAASERRESPVVVAIRTLVFNQVDNDCDGDVLYTSARRPSPRGLRRPTARASELGCSTSTVLRVRLTGDDAQLGRVAAGDVARMLLGVERAVARAAGHVIGRQVKPTGRRGRAIEETTRFRLLSIERGSIVGVLELPEEAASADTLNVDVPSLGPLALGSALATAAGEEIEQVDVAAAFVRLVDDVGVGSRFQALKLEAEGPAERTTVTLDRPARDRLFEIVSAAPSARDDSLVGVLVEADFESNTARLRTIGGQRIAISFETELADRIQEGLRRQSEFRGEVSYDPTTSHGR